MLFKNNNYNNNYPKNSESIMSMWKLKIDSLLNQVCCALSTYVVKCSAHNSYTWSLKQRVLCSYKVICCWYMLITKFTLKHRKLPLSRRILRSEFFKTLFLRSHVCLKQLHSTCYWRKLWKFYWTVLHLCCSFQIRSGKLCQFSTGK